LQDITNQNVLPVKQRKALFSLRKALTLSSFASAIRTWQLKKISRDVEKTLERVTRATQQKTSSVPVTGLAKLGEEEMRVEDVLAKLEKHEAECNLRYQRVEEKLTEQKKTLDGLDLKIWGLGILIIVTPIIHKFLG
jgi:uncharacterized protein Yka (UPF0111/DUF47 family)